MKNLGWWIFGGAAALVVVYLLTRDQSTPFLGSVSRTDANRGLVNGLLNFGSSIVNAIGTSFSGGRSSRRDDGGDGATSIGDSFSVDYGGGDLSPDEERAARDLEAEL